MMKTSLVVVLFAAACGGGSKTPPSVKIDPAAANALVPAALQAKLTFEEKSVQEERGRRSKTTYTAAAPKSWTADDKIKMFATLRPPTEDGYGNFTEMRFGSNCDGACESKDWAKVSEKVDFAQYRSKKIVKDEAGKTSHLMTVEDGDDTHVIYAWWVDGGDHYYTCRVTLSKGFSDSAPDPRPAAPAFEKACAGVNIKTSD
jgi:hypothetical protein